MSSVSSTTSTTTSASTGGDTLRITGMVSGLDVDSMVTKMMAGEQAKIDKAQQDMQIIQWKQAAYQDIISDIKSLQSTFFDVSNPDNCLLLSSTYAAFDVASTSTGSSAGTTVATASAGVGATTGNYSLNVQQLAQSATINGSALNTQVKVTSFNSADWQNKKMSFDVGGTEYTITLDNTAYKSLNDVVSNINKQITADTNLNGKVSASFMNIDNGGSDPTTGDYIRLNSLTSTSVKVVDDAAGGHPTEVSDADFRTLIGKTITSVSANTALTTLNSGLNKDLNLNLNYNGNNITVDLDNTTGDKTIGDLCGEINTASGGQVLCTVDDITGKLILKTLTTGSTSSLSITGDNDGGQLLSALGLSVTGTPVQGKDALVSITPPGATTATTLTESSNNFTLNSISYSLDSTGTTNISVSTDAQKVEDKIKNFLTKYNAIVEKVHTKLTEKKNLSYAPLTDAQKSSMKDTDITNWETQAKLGILRNDDNLTSMLNSMRQAFVTGVTNAGLSLGKYGSNSIGLDTSDDSSQAGQIIIVDETKLKNAISQNGSQIAKLFSNVSSSSDSTSQYNENGICTRLKSIFDSNVGSVGTNYNTATLTKFANFQDDFSLYGGSGDQTLPDQIYAKDIVIKNLQDEFKTKQEQYYQQFSKLETALQQMNSQQSVISQLSGGN